MSLFKLGQNMGHAEVNSKILNFGESKYSSKSVVKFYFQVFS